jgi:MFS family permease
MWMDQVARGWLLYDLTGSPLELGLVSALRVFPLLFLSPLAGTFADHYGRKTQLILALGINVLSNAVLGLLILSGGVQPWHVYATALVVAVVQVFQVPVRHALVPETVDRAYLTNAISLNSLAFNVSRSIGPAIAGAMIALVGTGWCYIVQTVIFGLSTVWTAQMRIPDRSPIGGAHAHRGEPGVFGSTVEGWRYIGTHPTIRAGLIVSAVVSFFGMSFATLIPVFAKDVLDAGPTGQGLLLTAIGVGAVGSAFVIGAIGDDLPKGLLMLAGVSLYGLSILGFAASPWLLVSMALMLVTGVCNVACTTLIQTVLQAQSAPEMRGRVMAAYQQHHVLNAAGGLAAGALALVWGPQVTVASFGAACIVAAVAIWFALPIVRGLR